MVILISLRLLSPVNDAGKSMQLTDLSLQEMNTSKITIQDYSPRRIEWMLKWMYSGGMCTSSLGSLRFQICTILCLIAWLT